MMLVSYTVRPVNTISGGFKKNLFIRLRIVFLIFSLFKLPSCLQGSEVALEDSRP